MFTFTTVKYPTYLNVLKNFAFEESIGLTANFTFCFRVHLKIQVVCFGVSGSRFLISCLKLIVSYVYCLSRRLLRINCINVNKEYCTF